MIAVGSNGWKKMELQRSTSSFDVSKHCASNKIILDQLQHLQSYRRIVVTIKVVQEGEAMEVH